MRYRYTLDTDTTSEILKKNTVANIKYEESLLIGDDIYINAISYYEIKRWSLYKDYKPRLKKYEEMRRECKLILMDDISIFDKAAEIHTELERRGKADIGDIDILIASIACIRNLIVVTRNMNHFGFIKDFIPDLGIENWAG